MNTRKIIYSLCVKDILTVMEDEEIDIKLSGKDIKFFEDKVGDMIDWRGTIEFALNELKYSQKKLK